MHKAQTLAYGLLYTRSGHIFRGRLLFPCQPKAGELVFHTGMSGYQEILTDPSYSRQIITFSYPHIGNTGINNQDTESNMVHACGMLVRCPEFFSSNYRAIDGLYAWLEAQQIPVLGYVDTRAITKVVRDEGATDAVIVAIPPQGEQYAITQAKALLADFKGLKGQNLAHEVSTKQSYSWSQPVWHWSADSTKHEHQTIENIATDATTNIVIGNKVKHTGTTATDNRITPLIAVIDYGVKFTMLRLLVSQGFRVQVFPSNTNMDTLRQYAPHGVLLANGPGDPDAVSDAIACIDTILTEKLPLLAICLGFQLLALTLGANTKKMKFGHHGANHPIRNHQDEQKGTVTITSQNHGFMVDANSLIHSLGDSVSITHTSLFDGSLQGFRLTNAPVIAVQGHPEASPGPHDWRDIFEQFAIMVNTHHAQA